jgi:hypothetical protein
MGWLGVLEKAHHWVKQFFHFRIFGQVPATFAISSTGLSINIWLAITGS